MLTLYDETGLNPLPAGVQVSVYPSTGAQNASTLVGTAFTTAGGLCDIDVVAAQNYVAVFYSQQGPTEPQTFTASGIDSDVVCGSYISPARSQAGFTLAEAGVLPKGPGWFSDAAKQPGGVAYPVLFALAYVLELLSLQEQVNIESMRFQSCATDAEIDSFAYQYVGGFVPRYGADGETGKSYRARVIALLSGQKTTLAGIQAIVNAFYLAIVAELASMYAPNFTFGNFGGYSSSGGFNQTFDVDPADILPTVLVWDRQSRPDLADRYNVNPSNDNGDFVIEIGFNPLFPNAWFLDHSHIGLETFLIDNTTVDLSDTAPDPRLGALVDLVKQGGCHPLYLTHIADA